MSRGLSPGHGSSRTIGNPWASQVRHAAPRDACHLGVLPSAGRGSSGSRTSLPPPKEHAMTELAHRTSNGLDVSLLWSPHTGRLLVAVTDLRTDVSFAVDAP